MTIRLYDVIYSLQKFFEDKLGVRADWVFDGYKHPTSRPYITIEILTDERVTLSKQRESVQIIDHLQIGYHAINVIDRTDMSEEISDLLTFQEIPYFNTEQSITEPTGDYFIVEITAVTPISPEDISRTSEYHRVYLDRKSTRLNSSHVAISYA